MVSEDFAIVGETVGPGERRSWVAQADVGHTTVQLPIVVIRGNEPGPRVTVTAGVHGSEYVAIETARRLALTDPAEVHGALVVVPIVNTTAFFRRSIYTSGLDDRNLNRMFPGDPEGSPSERLAAWLLHTLIEPSDVYIDLHGGDMIEALVPFVLYCPSGDARVDERARDLALASGVPRVIYGRTSGSTYSSAAAFGIPAVLLEVGGQGVWREEEVEQQLGHTRRVLRHVGLLEGGEPEREPQAVYEEFAWMRSHVDGLFHPAVSVGERVEEGQPIGRIVDYFGEELQPLRAVTGGEIVFLVTALAINVDDPLLAICH